jgi:hypothetical protein
MAAGQGFKTFTTGEVLTAGDVNGYLMQGVLVFASAAARNAAITSPQEGQFAFTKDTNGLWYYDGAAWVASGATGDIEGVTAGIGISGGGTSGTVTVTNSMATAIDAKGDLVAGTGADTFAKLTVGANGTTLVADSSEATGLKWATASSGGMTLISETVASALSSLTFSSLGSYKQLLLVYDGLYYSANGVFALRFNNDSGSNYVNQALVISNNAASNNASTTAYVSPNWSIFGQSVTSATEHQQLRGYITIDNYTSSTKRKAYYGSSSWKDNQYNEVNSVNYVGSYNSTTAITSLDIVQVSGTPTLSNTTNTTIRLYGVA